MPPPRATKKSSHTSLTAGATRQGSKQSREQIFDEDEEMDEVENADEMDMEEDDQDEQTPDGPVEELVSNMVNDARKRHAARKQNITKSFDIASETVQNSITTLFDQHEAKASSAHQAQMKRLTDLLAHKARLEQDMEARLTHLREIYDAHSRDVESVLKRRIKELE
ncbi:hypothetical protein FB567DRAFT_552602 [Paraphoma chrysanthemicola]|uniref:Uncharacterized protein n=1 Tax=Paraphoma chrysanthemicola TaxID=798071 RepID=A0A8K0QXV6_9PLEO|nr:hypothetical protein FB567DRAFT_552602 [Paraphoma chrysanthemicola]